jgi:hypothetical protein
MVVNPIPFILPILSTLMGQQILVATTRFQLLGIESFAGGIAVGMTVTSLFALVLNSFFSCSFFHFIVQCGIAAGVFVALLVFGGRARPLFRLPSKTVTLFLILFFGFLSYLSYIAYIEVPGKMLATGENDMALEFSYIASFAFGANKKRGFLTGLLLPLSAYDPGKSEYLPCIYTALLQVAGFKIEFAVFVQTQLLFLSIIVLQFCFALRISKSEYASLITVPIIFLIGGFGFMRFLVNRSRLDPNVEYIFYMGENLYNMWGHPLLHCILTSRVVLLTMALSILVFVLLESRFVFLPGLIVLVTILIRPQTAASLFLCYVLYEWKLFSSRVVFVVPALVSFKLIGLGARFPGPLWDYECYAGSIMPVVRFPLSIFGLLFPSLLFCLFHSRLLERIVGPLVTFYVLSCISLQRELRFNFFGLIVTVVPILVTMSITALHRFGRIWKSEEAQGTVNALILFASIIMCLSSLLGIWTRIGQKFIAWDADGKALAKWVMKHTSRDAVFACEIPGRWNPAVMIAGRVQYIPMQPTLQSAEYHADDKIEDMRLFMQNGTPVPDADYFLVEKRSRFQLLLKSKIGVNFDLVYENDRYELLQRRS